MGQRVKDQGHQVLICEWSTLGEILTSVIVTVTFFFCKCISTLRALALEEILTFVLDYIIY